MSSRDRHSGERLERGPQLKVNVEPRTKGRNRFIEHKTVTGNSLIY